MLTSGASVDWRLVDAVGPGDVHAGADGTLRSTRARYAWIATAGWAAIVAIGLVQVGVAALSTRVVLSPPGAPIPSWLFLTTAGLFGVCGALLLLGGRQDARLSALGVAFVTVASAFAHPLLMRASEASWVSRALAGVSVDGCFAAAVWQFAWAFPDAPRSRDLRRFGQLLLGCSVALGVVLLVANALDAPGRWDGVSLVPQLLRALDRDNSRSFFWIGTLVTAGLAVPYLYWKATRDAGDERHRITFVFLALVVGIAPFLLAVAVSLFVPDIARPPWRQLTAVVLYSALASTIPTLAYAVLVERVMDLRLAVARARQWQIARYSASLVGLVLVCALALDLHLHRDLTLSSYVAGGRGVGAFLLGVVGFAALTFRHQLVRGVDKLFLAERPSHGESLSRLERLLQHSQSIRTSAEGLIAAVERSVGATRVAVLVVNEQEDRLVPLAGTAPPLAMDSAVADIVRAAETGTRVHLHPSGRLWSLLPERDQDWLRAAPASLLVPILGSAGRLMGIAALGDARHGLPYTDEDHALVRSMCGQVGLRIENLALREQRQAERGQVTHPGLHWAEEPAQLCMRCSRAWPPTSTTCACGASLEAAHLPLLTAGKFRLERRLGAGGMGVVYLATDVMLERRVALKTLPHLGQSMAARLEREAKAMATVLHPNLALVYGVERWRGNPVLIEEYLDGGTLLDSLRRGRFTVSEMLGLGILVADVLERLHGVGILHRDVKPSNIGYTGAGTPKLLDLSLAAVLVPSRGEGDRYSDAAGVTEVEGEYAVTSDSRRFGTLRYMSPEALAGGSPTPSFDVWALAVVLYEVIAGRHPLSHLTGGELVAELQRATFADVREFCDECPAGVARFFHDALSVDPGRRPPTAAAFRGRLQSLVATIQAPVP